MPAPVSGSGTRLSHFGFCKLIVDDLDEAAKFYREVFGIVDLQRVTKDHSATTGGPIDEITFRPTADGGPSLTLLKLEDRPAPPIGETVLGFVTADLEALLDRAVAAGGSIANPIVEQPDHGVRVAFVRDNQGHLIEVVELNLIGLKSMARRSASLGDDPATRVSGGNLFEPFPQRVVDPDDRGI
jgi:predicted enzyme related to lactoylglutathione lyase